jgi:hypothetical protein
MQPVVVVSDWSPMTPKLPRKSNILCGLALFPNGSNMLCIHFDQNWERIQNIANIKEASTRNAIRERLSIAAILNHLHS